MRTRRKCIIVVAAAAALLSACGSSGSSGGTATTASGGSSATTAAEKMSATTASSDDTAAATTEPKSASTMSEGTKPEGTMADSATTAAAGEPMKLRVGVAPDIFFAPLYIAAEKGFFEEQGITAEVTDFSTGVESGQALVTGQIDITGETQNLGVILPATNPVKTISSFSYNGQWWGLLAKEGITSVQDLVGKKVATQTGAQGEQWLRQLVEKNGVNFDDIDFQDIKFAQLIPAFARGDVDAIVTYQPNVQKALDTTPGSTAIAWGSDDDLAPVIGFIVASDAIANDPAAGKRVVAAVGAADEWITNNLDEAVDIVSKKTGIDDKAQLKAIMSNVDYNVGFDDTELKHLEQTVTYQASQGNIPAETTLDSVIVKGLDG